MINTGFNSELYEDIVPNLRHFKNKVDAHLADNFYTDEEVLQELVLLAEDFGKLVYNKPWTLKEVMKLVNLAEHSIDWYSLDSDIEAKLICDYLEIEYGEPFQTGIMRESSVRYACPEALSDDYLKYIKAVVQENGIFAYVTNKRINNPNKELSDNLYDEDFYTEYYAPWMSSDQDIKDYFEKKLGISATDIEILTEDEYNNIIQA